MTIALVPNLRFDGNAREAVEFYHRVFGGELGLLTFGEGMGETDPEIAERVMHASLYLERGIHLMVSDVPQEGEVDTNGIMTLSSDDADGQDAEKLTSWWELLQEDAEVTMPLEQAPWGDRFGSLTDRFGIKWMLSIPASQG